MPAITTPTTTTITSTPSLVGHRGCRGIPGLDENTIPAFLYALEHGATALELDEYLTQDEKLAVHHDRSLGRMAGYYQLVNDTGSETISSLRTPNGHKIPFLPEVLEATHGKLPGGKNPTIFIEIKDPNSAELIVRFIEQAVQSGKWQYHELPVISFLKKPLEQVRVLSKNILLGATFEQDQNLDGHFFYEEKNSKATLNKILEFNPNFINPHVDVITPDMVKAAHEKGIKVNVWTVNTDSQLERALWAGADSIMGDDIKNLKNRLPEVMPDLKAK